MGFNLNFYLLYIWIKWKKQKYGFTLPLVHGVSLSCKHQTIFNRLIIIGHTLTPYIGYIHSRISNKQNGTTKKHLMQHHNDSQIPVITECLLTKDFRDRQIPCSPIIQSILAPNTMTTSILLQILEETNLI